MGKVLGLWSDHTGGGVFGILEESHEGGGGTENTLSSI